MEENARKPVTNRSQCNIEDETWESLDDDKNWPTLQTALHQTTPTRERPPDPLPDEHLRATHPYFASQPKVRILSRDNNNTSKPAQANQGATPTVATEPQKSYEERQRDYERARAAIFSSPNPNSSGQTTSNQPKGGWGAKRGRGQRGGRGY